MDIPKQPSLSAPNAPVVVIDMEEERVTTRRSLADSRPTTRVGRWKETIRYMRGRGAMEISIIYVAIAVTFVAMDLADVRGGFPFLSPANTSGVLSQSIPILAPFRVA